ncbi:MAG: hypothetical protein F4Z72_15385 [Gemmatimonadales bacterium]|nr:hypothetical protein [Candidatus Palauibacter irciniicola]MYC18250.1 hypothetical protein [Gemmatimonadales bacterium]
MTPNRSEASPVEELTFLDRNFRFIAAGFAALHLVLGVLVFEPILFTGGDNAHYLILGEALRTGEGYRDLYLPGTPLHARYPPLFPMFLAVLGWVGGVNLAKAAMLLLTAGIVWITAHFARRHSGAGPAVAAAALLSVNPTLLEYGHYVLSEAPFTLLVLTALLFSQREGRQGAVLMTLAACAAFATRSAGMALLLALPMARLLAGSRRQAVWSAVGGATAMASWLVYQRFAAADAPSYLEVLLQRDPYTPESGTLEFTELVTRVAGNTWTYASRILPETLFGPGAGTGGVSMVLGLGVALAALVGWAIFARERARGPELFVVLYGGIIATWPSAWSDRRFLLPLIPVILTFAVAAVWRLPRAPRRWLWWAVPAVLAAFGTSWIARTAPGRLECAASYAVGAPCDGPQWASLYAAAIWARENTQPDAIIANRKPRLFYWYSRRRGDAYPLSSDPDVVLGGLEEMGADYVVVDQVSGTTGRYLVPAIQAYQTRFELVYEDGDPPSYIFRLLPAPASTD